MKTKGQGKLPQFLRPYFWDVKFVDLRLELAPKFILKRIVDRGGLKAWRWARQRYSLDDVKNLVTTSRDLNRRTAAFWARVFNLRPEEVPCLRKPYSPMPF